jgi:hypothetical protein
MMRTIILLNILLIAAFALLSIFTVDGLVVPSRRTVGFAPGKSISRSSRSVDMRTRTNEEFLKGQVIGPLRIKKVILNDNDGSRSYPDEDMRIDGVALAKTLRKKLLEIKSEFMQDDGRAVEYKKAKSSDVFRDYLELSKSLKYIPLGSMEGHERKAFFINIYNCLIVHAIISGMIDEDSGTFARLKMYASASYNICGLIFSLNDIENGILRGNRRSAVPFTSLPFTDPFDPRIKYSVDCDPRIHFALNCGALGCPPIAAYSADERVLDAELTRATEGFLEQSVDLDAKTRTVTISMLFSWYKEDFGGSDAAIFDWVSKNASLKLENRISKFKEDLRDNSELLQWFATIPKIGDWDDLKVKIRFSPYDWTLNSAS